MLPWFEEKSDSWRHLLLLLNFFFNGALKI